MPTLGLHGDCWISSITPMSIIKEEVEQFLDNVLLSKQERRKRKKMPVEHNLDKNFQKMI